MNKILELISDSSGSPSTMRLAMLLVLLSMLIPKVWFGIKTGTPVQFSNEDLETLGIIFGAKAIQSHAENSNPTKP